MAPQDFCERCSDSLPLTFCPICHLVNWQWLSGVPAASCALCHSQHRTHSQLRDQPLDFKFGQNFGVKSKEKRHAWAVSGGRYHLVCNLRQIHLFTRWTPEYLRTVTLAGSPDVPPPCGFGRGKQVKYFKCITCSVAVQYGGHQYQVSI